MTAKNIMKGKGGKKKNRRETRGRRLPHHATLLCSLEIRGGIERDGEKMTVNGGRYLKNEA